MGGGVCIFLSAFGWVSVNAGVGELTGLYGIAPAIFTARSCRDRYAAPRADTTKAGSDCLLGGFAGAYSQRNAALALRVFDPGCDQGADEYVGRCNRNDVVSISLDVCLSSCQHGIYFGNQS